MGSKFRSRNPYPGGGQRGCQDTGLGPGTQTRCWSTGPRAGQGEPPPTGTRPQGTKGSQWSR